jgi:hypothetical protein
MTDIFVSEVAVPKRYRNGKIYGGNSFDSTNFFEMSNFGGGQRHVETGRIEYENGDSRTITIPFVKAFERIPVLVSLEIYRIAPLGAGGWTFQDVLIKLNAATFSSETGFEFIVDDSEDMEGVILNYNFTE